MDTKKVKKEDIIALAEKTKHYCDLLIEQSDNWLSEEEGVRNVEKRMAESKPKTQKKKNLSDNKAARIIIGILLSISFSSIMYGQPIDSLFNVFVQNEGKRHLRTGNELTHQLFEAGHLSQHNAFSEQDNSKAFDAYVYGAMALYCSDHGNFAEAIIYNEKSLTLYRILNDSTRIIHKLQNLYVNFASTGQFDKALSCLEESLTVATAVRNEAMVANTLLCTGSLHAHQMNRQSAIECIEKGLVIKRKLNDTGKIIWALNSLCKLYTDTDQIEKAQRCIDEAYELCNATESLTLMLDCQLAMALIHQKKKEWDKAIAYLDTTLTQAEENNSTEFICLSLLQLGDVYMESNKNPQKAKDYFIRCIAENEKKDGFEDMMLAYTKLYELKKNKNAELALEYLEKSTELYKQLQKEETQNQLNNFHIQYQTAEKELEIERQNHVIRRQNWHRVVLLAGFVICLIFLVLFWYMLRLRTKRNRALAEMNATKDRFFSIISHDLKNPAIAQRDALQLLTEHADKWDADSLSQYYSELLKSADGQVELLYNLLNWAQVQTGRMPYSPTQFDLISALRPDITLIKNMATRKGITFDMQLPEMAVVAGDSNMLTTVIRNLLTNAVKFTAAYGTVTLGLKEEPDNHYTLSVSDTGTGMNNQQMQDLFHIDRQRSRTGTAGEQGSGLGLIVCKELVEKHGSTLHVESESGKGSRFWFEFSA